MAEAYDFVVIGAGSAGLTAAGFAAQLGARIALLEKTVLVVIVPGTAVYLARHCSKLPEWLTRCAPPTITD